MGDEEEEEEEEMGGGKKTRIRMFAARERVYSAWRGGSVLCGMNEFREEMWIGRDRWKEYGKSELYRR